MLKLLIIDDEAGVRNTIKEILQHKETDLFIEEAENVKTGLQKINAFHPNIVFLDINMPDGTGFDLLIQLQKIDFNIVFMTAHEEHIIKAFKLSTLDYILKPFDPDELINVVEKAKNNNATPVN